MTLLIQSAARWLARVFNRNKPDPIHAERERFMQTAMIARPDRIPVVCELIDQLKRRYNAQHGEAFRAKDAGIWLLLHVPAGHAHWLKEDRFRQVRPMYDPDCETWLTRVDNARAARNWRNGNRLVEKQIRNAQTTKGE